MSTPDLSLCMIVKNEAENLKVLLPQAKHFADEIIIVDTGSKDDTKAVARQFTPFVYDFEWIDDFSAARNFALSKAKGNYFIWLDADDRVPENSRTAINRLKKYFDGKKYFYFVLKDIRKRDRFYGKGVYAFLKQIRCAPLRDNIRFNGRIHESLNRALKDGGYIPVSTDIEIEHYGYDDIRLLKRKIKRNLRILLREKPYKKSDVSFSFLLARTYESLGMFNKAYSELSDFLRDNYPIVVEEYPHVLFEFYICLAEFALKSNDPGVAKRWLLKASGCVEGNKVAFYRMGMLCEKIDEFRMAIGFFSQILDAPIVVGELPSIAPPPLWEVYLRIAFCYLCLRDNGKYRKYTELAFKSGISPFMAYEWLAKHAFVLGKNKTSEGILLDAYKSGYGTPQIYCMLGELFSRSDRYVDAENFFKLAIREDPANDEIRLSVAWHYMRTGRIKLAGEIFEQVESTDENFWDVVVGKLVCCFVLGRDFRGVLEEIRSVVGNGDGKGYGNLLENLIIELQSEGKFYLVPYVSFILRKSF